MPRRLILRLLAWSVAAVAVYLVLYVYPAYRRSTRPAASQPLVIVVQADCLAKAAFEMDLDDVGALARIARLGAVLTAVGHTRPSPVGLARTLLGADDDTPADSRLPAYLRSLGYQTEAFVVTEDHVEFVPLLQAFDAGELFIDVEGRASRMIDEVDQRVRRHVTASLAKPLFLYIRLPDGCGGAPPRQGNDASETAGAALAATTEAHLPLYSLEEALSHLLDDLVEAAPAEQMILVVAGTPAPHEEGERLSTTLVVAAPGRVGPGRRVAQPVALQDVPATLTGLLGLPPIPSSRGIDRSPLIRLRSAPTENR